MKEFDPAVTDESAIEWRMPHMPKLKMPEFDLHIAGAQGRDSVENYIRNRFSSVHNAQVSHFLPNIISLRCGDFYSAAVGLAPAGNHKLFAETYLSVPAENAISATLGISVERNNIVEIGNLVSTWKGSSLLLFIFIGELMERMGYHWVLFTATSEVRRLLDRLHFSPIVLAEADPHALSDGGASWGSYYAHQPLVMCGDIRPALEKARKNRLYKATLAVMSRRIDKMCEEFHLSNKISAEEGNFSNE